MSGQGLDPTGAKILDGATRVLRDFGFKRATIELVAKYAGVSHMTIYRRWPSKNDLLRSAVVGEFTTLLQSAFDGATEPCASFAGRSLTAFTEIVWRLHSHPLVLRELSTESGEQLPLLPSTSSAVMDVCVPLVAEQLERLSATTEESIASLDSAADVFVRLAHSLVIVQRPDRPLTTRSEVAEYARHCFGPYLEAVARRPAPAVDDAVVVDLDRHRPVRKRHRPHLQIAAASLVGVMALGAGATAVLGGNITLPFVAPAGISKETAPEVATAPPPQTPAVPTLEDPGVNVASQFPAATSQPAPPSPPTTPSPAAPAVLPNPPLQIPQIQVSKPPAAAPGSMAGNPVDNGPSSRNPAPAPLGPPPPGPGPQPPKPGPPPPKPGPPPPKPGPPPPNSGPQQPRPGPGQPPNQRPAPPN